MIRLGTKKDSKGRPFWTVEVVWTHSGFQAVSTGWRYWPDTGEIRPPAVKLGRTWAPTWKEISPQFLTHLSTEVRKLLGERGEEAGPLDQYFEKYEENPLEFKQKFPHLFREVYIEYGARHTDVPDAFRALFERLPEGRLWPDNVLDDTVRALLDKRKDVDDLSWDLAEGIISQADWEWIVGEVRVRAGGER